MIIDLLSIQGLPIRFEKLGNELCIRLYDNADLAYTIELDSNDLLRLEEFFSEKYIQEIKILEIEAQLAYDEGYNDGEAA